MTIRTSTQIQVSHPTGHYPIYVGQGLLPLLHEFLGADAPFVIITDSQVGPLYANRLLGALAVLTFPAGEASKNLPNVRQLYSQLLHIGLDRRGILVALGGGVVGDVAGFVAATYLRGVRLVQCPTTLLAMVDSSLGGKTGVDLPEGKNLVGAFKQPELVLADLDVLQTLPDVEWACGLAEVVKHGLIGDPSILQRLETGQWTLETEDYGLRDRDRLLTQQTRQANLQSLVVDAIRVKQAVVQEDPWEQNRRAVLNLGHTFAHAIEGASGYRIRHGEAVAMGLTAAAHLSARLEHCAPELPTRIERLLTRLNLPTRIPANLTPAMLLRAMQHDKKREAGRLRLVLLRAPGDVFVTGGIAEETLSATLTALTTDPPLPPRPDHTLQGISRKMAAMLRHRPEQFGLTLDDEGWAPVEALLQALRTWRDEWRSLSELDLEQGGASATKPRYEIRDGRIRALYGPTFRRKMK